MTTMQRVLDPQEIKLYSNLCTLEKKEKQTYEALAALVTYLDNKRQGWELSDFNKFKKEVLKSAGELALCEKAKGAWHEPKFNVKHYERAILYASNSTYRDMAIQAANKDLNEEAMGELITALSRDCRRISRELKEITAEWRKSRALFPNYNPLWQSMVEPIFEESTERLHS